MPGTPTTTVTAGTAGAVFGSLVGAGLSALLKGAIAPELLIAGCSTLGAFTFGRIFGP